VDTVTLVLAGDVPVDQFSTAVSGLARLLQGLTHELAAVTVDQALPASVALP
jgi:hypothetical protein